MLRRTLPITSVLFPLAVSAQDAVKSTQHPMRGLHNDPKAYIAALEDPRRDLYQKPAEVLAALEIKPGEIMADIGAGSGYFTFRLARQVSERGGRCEPGHDLAPQSNDPRSENHQRGFYPRRS
jgi:predicted methyltransferase